MRLDRIREHLVGLSDGLTSKHVLYTRYHQPMRDIAKELNLLYMIVDRDGNCSNELQAKLSLEGVIRCCVIALYDLVPFDM